MKSRRFISIFLCVTLLLTLPAPAALANGWGLKRGLMLNAVSKTHDYDEYTALAQLKLPDGEVAVMLSIEGCEPFDPGLHTIAEYRAHGVRMAAITWNHENTLGYPAMSGSTQGLKPYGVQAIREMQRLGIAADVSHLNEAGVFDILNKTDKPPMASHSNCRALVDHPRNLSDEQLRAMFKAGGFVGVNFWPTIIGEPANIDHLIDHIAHMYDIGGEGKVGFGSDFDGIERKPEGLNNPADFPKLIDGLRRRGFAEKDVADIAGLGLIHYFERIKV